MTPEQKAILDAARRRAADANPPMAGPSPAGNSSPGMVAPLGQRGSQGTPPEQSVEGAGMVAPVAMQPAQASPPAISARQQEILDGARARAQGGESGGMVGALNTGARMIVNDINAGFQGTRPGKVSKEMPVGVLVGGGRFVDVDGQRIPVERFSPDMYLTQIDPETGRDMVYARTKENKASPWEAPGRLLGYGTLGGAGRVSAGRGFVSPPSETQVAAKAGARLGVVPSIGTFGPVSARAAAAGEAFLPTAGVIVDDMIRASDELAGAAQSIAGRVGQGATAQDAGGALIRGARTFVDRTKGVGSKMFDEVGRHIPASQMFPATNTERMLSAKLALFQGQPALESFVGSSKLRPFLDDIAGGLSYEQMKTLRTSVGEALGKKGNKALSDQAEGTLKSWYAALSSDMEAAARAAGPEATKAFTRANKYWGARASRIEGALDVIYKRKGDLSPEKAFADFSALTAGQGGRANVGKLAKIKKSMPQEEWREVVATTLRKMGEATPGTQNAAGDAFSGNTFLTTWSRMDPTAKRILFEGGGIDVGVRTELDALVMLLDRAKDATRQLNASRSGAVGSSVGLAAGVMVAPQATIVTSVLAHLGARVLTNREVLRGLQTWVRTGQADRISKFAAGSTQAAKDVSRALRLANEESQQQ
jgi:hypothetical protein